MKYRIVRCCTLFLTVMALQTVRGQEATVAAGANAAGSNGSITYSIGQIAFEATTDGNYSVNPGAQQPYEITETLSIKDLSLGPVLLYPNPTDNLLNLKVDNLHEDLVYQLYTLEGRVLEEGKISVLHTALDIRELPAAVYMLSLKIGDKPVKAFKIIKN